MDGSRADSVTSDSQAPCRSHSGGRAGRRTFAARIFRGRVAATPRLQRGYSEGRYLGRPETDGYRCTAMAALGNGLRETSRPDEALPVLEANLALMRRYWSRDKGNIFTTQANLASCLADLGRLDEALVLERDIYAKQVASLGVSHQDTIGCGLNLAISLVMSKRYEQAKFLLSDQLLPAARRTLGADHDLTLKLNNTLVGALYDDPEGTRETTCVESNT